MNHVRHPLLAALPLLRSFHDVIPCGLNGLAEWTRADLDDLNGRAADLCRALDLCPLEFVDLLQADCSVSEVVSEALSEAGVLQAIYPNSPPESMWQLLERLRSPETFEKTLTLRFCSARTRVVHLWGNSNASPVVIVGPTGMPAELMANLASFLCKSTPVVTIEPLITGYPLPTDSSRVCVENQAGDIGQILEHLDLRHCHVMGFCGGAVVALMVAESPRVHSVSLWHGVYELGESVPKTQHQKDFLSMLEMASRSARARSDVRRAMMSRKTRCVLPKQMTPLLLFPYCCDAIFALYIHESANVMQFDCRRIAAQVRKPLCVLTSPSDRTAHPAGATALAAMIATANTAFTGVSEHLDLFANSATLRKTVSRVLREIAQIEVAAITDE